jgi:hypothetical protein
LSFVIVAVLTYGIVLYTYYFKPGLYSPYSLNRLDELVLSTIRSCSCWLDDIFHGKGLGASAKHFQDNNIRKTTTRAVARRTSSHSLLAPTSATDEALFKVLLALSDQQLFTGMAILTLAYAQMESVVAYHAAIIESMATLAFVVYDSASTIMFSHLRKPENFFMMTWRAVLILAFMILLLVTQLPLGNKFWLESYGMPFKCFWRDFEGNYNYQDDPNLIDMVLNMAWMVMGISNTLLNYFPNAFRRLSSVASVAVKALLLPRCLSSLSLKKSQETNIKAVRVVYITCRVISLFFAVLVFIVAEISASVAFSLQGSWFLIISSVSWSFFARSRASGKGRVDDENEWGFGQAVPVFLLGLPFFALAEAVWGTSMPFFPCPSSDVLTLPRCILPEASRRMCLCERKRHANATFLREAFHERARVGCGRKNSQLQITRGRALVAPEIPHTTSAKTIRHRRRRRPCSLSS